MVVADLGLQMEIPPFQHRRNDKIVKRLEHVSFISIDKTSHHFKARTAKIPIKSFETLSIHSVFNPL